MHRLNGKHQDPSLDSTDGKLRLVLGLHLRAGTGSQRTSSKDTWECEGDLTATSVTPLISKFDLADPAGWAGVLFLHHWSMCVPPKAALS